MFETRKSNVNSIINESILKFGMERVLEAVAKNINEAIVMYDSPKYLVKLYGDIETARKNYAARYNK